MIKLSDGLLWQVDQAHGGWPGMADTVFFGSFGREAAAPYPFDLAGVTAVAARVVEVTFAADLPLDLGDGGGQVFQGEMAA